MDITNIMRLMVLDSTTVTIFSRRQIVLRDVGWNHGVRMCALFLTRRMTAVDDRDVDLAPSSRLNVNGRISVITRNDSIASIAHVGRTGYSSLLFVKFASAWLVAIAKAEWAQLIGTNDRKSPWDE